MLKEAPWTDHQERSNRAALPCERVQFARRPGGSPVAMAKDTTFILKTTVALKIDLGGVSAVRWGDITNNVATDAVKTVSTTSRDKKIKNQMNVGIRKK